MRWATDLQDLAPSMGPVPAATVHPTPGLAALRPRGPLTSLVPLPASARPPSRAPAAPGIVWVDGYSAAVAQDQPDPSSVVTLVFGSARHPGGGWTRGATAQEEDLSLCSSWALAAQQAPAGFYDLEHRWEGPSAGLWATGHWFARAPGDWLDDPVPAAFAGVSAPNLRWARAQGVVLDSRTLDRAQALLVERLAWALRITARKGRTTLVGGMIGTGVFGWDPAAVLNAWASAWRTTPASQRPQRLVMAVPGWNRWDPDRQALAHAVQG